VLLRVTREGRALYERINGELIAQQAELIRGLDAEIRAGATEVIRRLARAAEDRFISGMSVGSCEPTCADGAGDAPSCA
jgi:hypothetical protein